MSNEIIVHKGLKAEQTAFRTVKRIVKEIYNSLINQDNEWEVENNLSFVKDTTIVVGSGISNWVRCSLDFYNDKIVYSVKIYRNHDLIDGKEYRLYGNRLQNERIMPGNYKEMINHITSKQYFK